MLILTRRVGDSIIIDNEIFITVYGLEKGQVRLGFDAPREVNILRKELWDKEQYANGVLVQANEPHLYKMRCH